MQAVHHRYDISVKVWELLEPPLPGREGTQGVTPVIIEIFSMRFLDLANGCVAARFDI